MMGMLDFKRASGVTSDFKILLFSGIFFLMRLVVNSELLKDFKFGSAGLPKYFSSFLMGRVLLKL